jgi:hypothetical protein
MIQQFLKMSFLEKALEESFVKPGRHILKNYRAYLEGFDFTRPFHLNKLPRNIISLQVFIAPSF